MVDVLDSVSLHQEQFPPEIDMYKVPHDRMKELVTSITEKLPEIQESLNYDRDELTRLETILEHIYSTVWELKTHEMIENTVIMTKLKERLHARQIYNQSVCSCHEDSPLVRIIDLVEMVYSSSDGQQRNFYWHHLQEALYEFLDDFLPHMEEEENTFQPLLNEYFNYEELKEIHRTVLSQHEEWKEKVTSEKSLKRFKRDSECSDKVQEEEENFVPDCFNKLPEEIIFAVFSCLDNPKEFSTASQVCKRWNKVSKSSQFWRNIPLSQWERNIWTWSMQDLAEIIERDDKTEPDYSSQPDIYENILPILKLTGSSVRRLSVSGSKTLTNSGLRELLKTMSSVRELNLSYTNVCHAAFNDKLLLTNVEKMDMSGCQFVTDECIKLLLNCLSPTVQLKWLSLSGCELITDKSLDCLRRFKRTLLFLDFSGCNRLTGSGLKSLLDDCPNVKCENISYCSYILDGPDPNNANGCQNIDCDVRFCCSSYQN